MIVDTTGRSLEEVVELLYEAVRRALENPA
jgi:hypothetical protein